MNISYIRNSRLKQENSVSTQKQLINDFCNTHNIILDKIIVDEGISGSGDKTNKREGYLWVMNKIERGEIDTLIVISISRWGRNLGEIYKSVELMQQHNIKFYSIKENIDTSSIYGKFTINLLSSLYEMELGLISERVSDTLKVKKENGKVYSKTPYGFDRVGNDLIENQKELKLIRKMFRLRNQNQSYNKISEYLNRNRHKPKFSKKWNKASVYSVMKTNQNNGNITSNMSYL